MIKLVFRECLCGLDLHYLPPPSRRSALIQWFRQSFSWSTWSAPNAGWCAPPSCRAWAGALSDWSSSTPNKADSDTEMTPEWGDKQERRGKKKSVNKTERMLETKHGGCNRWEFGDWKRKRLFCSKEFIAALSTVPFSCLHRFTVEPFSLLNNTQIIWRKKCLISLSYEILFRHVDSLKLPANCSVRWITTCR